MSNGISLDDAVPPVTECQISDHGCVHVEVVPVSCGGRLGEGVLSLIEDGNHLRET